jgi:predicted helicase
MTLQEYITTISQRFQLGNATEHTFRGDLQQLLESIVPEVRATNEPKRQSCGAPDYIITRGEIPVGFIEAKDIGDKDLEGNKKTGNQEQFERYKLGLSNLIITDYLDFHFYKDGSLNTKISIGKVDNGKIIPLSENFDSFIQLFRNFTTTISQTIKSPTRLAEMMAGKARLMADIIEKSLNEDDEQGNMSNLKRQMLSFQKMLISDIDNKSYSDLYSQTISYGLFAARYHDPSLPTFSREEALKLIPRSNPFLRKLFKDISDDELDFRLVWIVDELVSVFLASDVASIMKDFGKSTKQEDPVVHFYETFLGAYNPAIRKQRGVWYTPQPVVNFIVRAVDDILKKEFDFKEGLADSSKKKIKVSYQGKEIEKEVHQVQVLDPATGTGTFLSETIKHIHKNYEGMQGIWSKYVEDDLIPRINGFELLMASYAMAHLKLDMLLTDTGYIPTKEQRLRVFLTNSLEEPHSDSGTLWGNILSDESDQANEVKRDTPVMCVIGNPPYSVSSSNKGKWILRLLEDFKKNLNEVKINLDDDYIKFIKLGQHYIQKNNYGIVSFISNNSFLDGITHRRMRESLLETFDKIYIIDLHGNSRKREVCPDGSPDNNVFDIMQGVSINIFIKSIKRTSSAKSEVFHFDLQGKRDDKYNFLTNNSIETINWNSLNYSAPNYFFAQKDFSLQDEYDSFIKLNDLFLTIGSGMCSLRDKICLHFNKEELDKVLLDFKELETSELLTKYDTKDSRDWRIEEAKKDVIKNFGKNNYQQILYRPFDFRLTFYTSTNKGFIGVPQKKIALNFTKPNIGLILPRVVVKNFTNIQVTKVISEYGSGGANTAAETNIAPLYIYPISDGDELLKNSENRIPNLNKDTVNKIELKLNFTFTEEKETTKDTFAPIDILDYIYAVLHSPNYREKYKEFLKIDFPRVPYPKDKDTFWKLVKLGGEIRQIHLLESPVVDKPISKYPITGNNVVGKVKYQDGKVFINDTQFFENVPEVSWNFYIGGYQPAQKWLKDRKDRELQVEDIRHYLKIIVALCQTDRLMKEIDLIEIE